MKWLTESSIGRRLKRILVLTTSIALLLSMAGVLITDWFTMRSVMFDRLDAQASIIGSNSVAAMAFDDPASATRTLNILRNEEDILAAGLYDLQGGQFAGYQRGEGVLPTLLPPEGSGVDEGKVFVVSPVELDGTLFGNILLISDFSDWKRRQRMNILISAGVFFLSLIVAILLSSRLQRLVSEPILRLAATARRITEQQDYGLRADRISEDEIGRLVDDFNSMVEQVQLRDQELQGTQEQLEEKVRTRTLELTSLNKELVSEVGERKKQEDLMSFQARRSQALLELSPASEGWNEKSFVQRGLALAEELTGSKIAFLHFVNDEERTIELVTWSKRTLQDYCKAVQDEHYPVDQAGIWVDAVHQRKPVVFNDYANYPHKRGLPEGHAELNRLITLPILENGQVVMMTGVGNKETNYTDLDVETTLLVAKDIWRILQRRRFLNKITRFNRVLEQSHNEIYIFDRETFRFISVNLGARTNLGYSMAELRELTPLDLEPKFTVDSYAELIEPLKSGAKGKIQYTTVHSRKDGTVYPVEVHLQHVDEEPPVFVAIILDITEREKAESEQALLQRELQQARKMEALGQLTGGIAHDFNNILGIILGYTDFALDQSIQDGHADMVEYLRHVEKAAERAKGLVSQMLSFSRSKASDDKPLQLQPLLAEDIEMLRSTLPASIEIDSEMREDLPSVVMDPVQLNQLLMNLSINARDAMDGKGRLTIRLGWAVELELECAACRKKVSGDWIELSVSDTGSGIGPDVLERIFDPFYTTKGVGKGTGLGLSVIHGIVRSHGGHILVDTEVGKGTTFRVLFKPVREETQEKPGSVGSSSELLRGQGEHLLVLDDEPDLGNFLGDLLKSSGYQTTVMTDSRETLELFREKPDEFAMLITDQTMPGMTGVELVKAIRKIRPEIPVILNSGFSDHIDASAAAELDITYMEKPLRAKTLIQTIGELIQST